jgi:membrane protein DedA with SNARE-associated domain/rhodanese-related sulfurtransferase
MLAHQLILAIGQYGLIIVFINVLVNQIGLPVPAIPTLIFAGALAAERQLALAPLFVWSVFACLIADCGWYSIGQRYGIQVLKTLCRISLEPDSCVSQTQSRFERWGNNSLLLAKFIPGLSTIAPPLAGAMRIGWTRFIALSTAGAALWVASALGAGMLFKAQIAALLAHLDDIGSVAVIVIAAMLAAYIGYKWWERARFYESLRMARIGVAELYDLIQAGAKPVIVDVRSPTARALDPHGIPGALHIPLDDVSASIEGLPRDREIILYCSCPSEASAASVARILMNHGFQRVRPLHGGLDAWIAAGYAVVRVDEPAPSPGRFTQ